MKKLLSLLLITSSAFCSIVDHFNKAENKGTGHSMKGIDFIYMINLDERPERWKKSLDQLQKFGVTPYRFSAVNGWKDLSIADINDVGLKFRPGMQGGYMATSYHPGQNFEPSHEIVKNNGQAYFCHCMARGTIAIVLSHLSVLQDAYDAGYETIWVMEDDIEVMQDPNVLSNLIEDLDHLSKKRWDVLFTDRDIRDANGRYVPCSGSARRPNFNPSNPNHYAEKINIKRKFRKIGARFGATSMILRRSGIKKILNFIKEHEIFHPYDMDFFLPQGIRLFTVQRDVVTNQVDSDSDNGGENYVK